MNYHLDTTFAIDWHHESPAISDIQDEIIAGLHDVTYDALMELEYFAVPRVDREKELAFAGLTALATMVPITSSAARLAAAWLGRMDRRQRVRHFNDALIAAVTVTNGAVLLTGDKKTERVFPVRARVYS